MGYSSLLHWHSWHSCIPVYDNPEAKGDKCLSTGSPPINNAWSYSRCWWRVTQAKTSGDVSAHVQRIPRASAPFGAQFPSLLVTATLPACCVPICRWGVKFIDDCSTNTALRLPLHAYSQWYTDFCDIPVRLLKQFFKLHLLVWIFKFLFSECYEII